MLESERVIEISNRMRSLPEHIPRKMRILSCTICGKSDDSVRRRRCTGGDALCQICRTLPTEQLMSEALLRKRAPWLDASLYPTPIGTTINCKHPAFHRQRMYRWSDVAARCVELHLEIP